MSKELALGLQEIVRLLGYSSQIYANDTGKNSIAYGVYVDNAVSFLNLLYDYSIKIRKTYSKDELLIKNDSYGGLIQASYIEEILKNNNISPRKTQRQYGISVRYKKYVKKNTVIKLQEIYHCFDDYLIQNDIVWSPVLEINDMEPKMTYDLSIDEDHTFLVNGLVVHNCDVLKFLQQICGLSGSEADNVRRAIARKQMDRLEKSLPQIQEGYVKKSGKPREEAIKELEEYIQILIDASSYMFGYNHSVAYCLIGYLCAYLRYYHPADFILSYLNNADNEDDIVAGYELSKIYKVDIMPPRFRHSIDKYVLDKKDNKIYKGVSSIKYLNKDSAIFLYSLKDNKYDSFIDLLKDIFDAKDENNKSYINSRQMEILIKLQYFQEFGNNKKLLTIYNIFKELYGKKTLSIDKIQKLEIDEEYLNVEGVTKTEKQFKVDDMISVINNIAQHIPDESFSVTEQAKFEMEVLGYISMTYDVDKKTCYVTDVDTKYSPRISLYCLKNGKSVECKINKQTFKSNPLHKGDIIKTFKFEERYKQTLVDGEWKRTDTKEWWLVAYDKTKMEEVG